MICSVSLVFIMFYGGFGTNIKEAKPVIARSVVLSTAGVVLTAGLTGLFIHFVLGLSLLESLLTASVIGSTDAASVFGILRSKNLNLKEHTASLLEMESGSNDPISYMLTVILTGLLTARPSVFRLCLFQQLFFGFLPQLNTTIPGRKDCSIHIQIHNIGRVSQTYWFQYCFGKIFSSMEIRV